MRFLWVWRLVKPSFSRSGPLRYSSSSDVSGSSSSSSSLSLYLIVPTALPSLIVVQYQHGGRLCGSNASADCSGGGAHLIYFKLATAHTHTHQLLASSRGLGRLRRLFLSGFRGDDLRTIYRQMLADFWGAAPPPPLPQPPALAP